MYVCPHPSCRCGSLFHPPPLLLPPAQFPQADHPLLASTPPCGSVCLPSRPHCFGTTHHASLHSTYVLGGRASVSSVFLKIMLAVLGPSSADIEHGVGGGGTPGRVKPQDQWHPGLGTTSWLIGVGPGAPPEAHVREKRPLG